MGWVVIYQVGWVVIHQIEARIKANAYRPTNAALCFRMLRAFINWCKLNTEYKDFFKNLTLSTRMVTQHLAKSKPKKDVLQKEQLLMWFKAVGQIPNPVISSYLQTCFLLGGRREEVMSLCWADVDFKWKTINIGDKDEGEKLIPLTPYVESLFLKLRTLNNRSETPSPYVFFSSRSANLKLVEPAKAHRQTIKKAGIPHISIHGLRRSFITLAQWLDMPAGVIAQITGHKPSATAEKHYIVRPVDLLGKWHTDFEAWLLNEAGLT